MENFDLKKYLAENKLVKEDEDGDDKDHKHTYKQIDPDGTAECTKCGLRNSDPSKTGEKVLKESDNDGSQHHIDQIDDDLMYGEFGTVEEVNGYLDNIIAGIERIRIAKVKEIEEWEREEGIEPDFMSDDVDWEGEASGDYDEKGNYIGN